VDGYTRNDRKVLQCELPRKSGLQAIGDLPWGTHFCLLYNTGDELLEAQVPYFAEGLAENESCMWVTSDLVSAERARTALGAVVPDLDAFLASGQLEIISYADWYLQDGRFDGARVLRAWANMLSASEKLGFEGLRLSGDTFWLEKADWQGFMHYEEMVDRVIASKQILALCAYPLPKCSPLETFEVIANHDFAMIKEDGRWLSFKSASRQRLGQALRESEGRQHAILEAVQDAIIAFDRGGAIYAINAAGARMFGYEAGELLGADIRLILPEKWATHSALLKSRGNQYPKSGDCKETRGQRKNGELFPVEFTLAATRHNNVPIFVGSARDLSDKYEAEARLKRIQIDRLAAMGGIAAGLAHELNQPLSATKTYLRVAERLIETPLEQRHIRVEDALARAGEQVERAGRIINSLRRLASHGEPNKMFQSLHELIEKTCESFAGSFKDRNVELLLDLSAEEDTVLVDGVQIQQILTNLIKNAMEAMQEAQTRRLSISTFLSEDERIQVDIADSGPGVSERIRGQLFEPSPSTKEGGMGIGLPMSRVIIEAHDGKIWAQSNPGHGAVFSLKLPLMEAISQLEG
jgi:two-component system, LuxR family, sensor kinase FixL